MRLSARPLALIAVCGLAMLCTACGSNSKKIVGKWKMVSMTGKDGKEQKADIMGMSPILEFTADGNIKAGMDMSGLSEKMKQFKETTEKVSESTHVGKYKVSGDTIEFIDMDKSEDSPFGKDNKGNLKFDGDNLTITGEKGSMKFTRMK